ncbi:16S rRNA (guanine(527)-N(7))-methyltransferase GidB [[Clostridium] sordellii ATCC 9714]|nr:16S rRNA (guanine(527)-N(7))-methyltransferase GidB [[Clostridium] sordellii ATCC 9714] [Paeniclostridium sordellii ATCC 9714]
MEKFRLYREILVDWNQRMNLTGIEDEREVYIKHFLDSIAAVKNGYIKDGMSIIDVGTGAGFPGLPLRICLENTKVTLLDSLNKRINFLSEVCKNVGIKI